MLCHLYSAQLLKLWLVTHLGRDLSAAQWIGLCFCGELHLLNSLWEGDLNRSMSYLYKLVLTVNFNSMLRCDVINGILMQTNAVWDQASLFFLLWYCYVPRDGLCCTDIWCTCMVTDDRHKVDVDWSTQRLCECKALPMFVCVCFNYMHLSQMLLVIQTVYVYGNVYGSEYAKKHIKISLNDRNIHSL